MKGRMKEGREGERNGRGGERRERRRMSGNKERREIMSELRKWIKGSFEKTKYVIHHDFSSMIGWS